MFEVNAVLANKFDAPNYTPATSNITSETDESATSQTSTLDPRRYTQFDRTATNAGTATMSFDDFVDMVNPLQHIPVLSSIYRSVVGEKINPVARIAGDMMYSAPLGLASSAISGLSAIANSAIEASTGQDGTTHIIAALFGTDEEAPEGSVQLANNSATSTQNAQTAEAPLPSLPLANVTPVLQTPLDILSAPPSTKNSVASQTNSSPTPAADGAIANTLFTSNSKLLPLDRSRVNFSNTATNSNNIENQNRIIALSEGSHTMRLGHTIYTSPLLNGPKPLPIGAIPPVPATASTNTVSANVSVPSSPEPTIQNTLPVSTSPATPSLLSSQKNTVPPSLFDDAMILQRLNQYKNFATSPVPTGSTVDMTN